MAKKTAEQMAGFFKEHVLPSLVENKELLDKGYTHSLHNNKLEKEAPPNDDL